MNNVERWRKVDSQFHVGEIETAIRDLERDLSEEPVDHFKGLIGAEFSNPPSDVFLAINDFAAYCARSFDLQAIYLEMNGFDINYDRWFFSFFGYTQYVEDPDDLDWLCDWQHIDWRLFVLTGMQDAQREFEWYHENKIYEDKTYKTAYEISLLLVVSKYVRLIEKALGSGPLVKAVPVLATAHEFDIVGKFLPDNYRGET